MPRDMASAVLGKELRKVADSPDPSLYDRDIRGGAVIRKQLFGVPCPPMGRPDEWAWTASGTCDRECEPLDSPSPR